VVNSAKAEKEIQVPIREKLRILIVDDDVALAGFLFELFEVSEASFEAKAVYDGFTAGSYIQSFQPHIILIDIMMPGINGIEVCRFLKENNETRHIEIIAMTGKPTQTNVSRILDAGARECLDKPINVSQLMHAIYAAVQ